MSMEVERVQALATLFAAAGDIPSEFIRPEQEQPGATTFRGESPPQVPVIDLQGDEASREVSMAAEEWGIFQVVNHGIPDEVVKNLQRVGKSFFELDQDEKEKYAAGPGKLEGYGTKLQKEPEGKKSWVDFLFHKVWPPSAVNLAVWPRNPPDYREVNEEYTWHLIRVVEDLLGKLSEGLGLKKEVLKRAVGGEEEGLEYLLKINYYPPCPRPDLALGVVAHTDMSAITVLVPNEVPGLQVFKDGYWFDVDYIPNALIIHIGDQIEIASNGKYKSVLHRTTVNKEKTRMSWPVFVSPPEETVVGPLAELVDLTNNPSKFKTKKYKDYQYCKINKLPQ